MTRSSLPPPPPPPLSSQSTTAPPTPYSPSLQNSTITHHSNNASSPSMYPSLSSTKIDDDLSPMDPIFPSSIPDRALFTPSPPLPEHGFPSGSLLGLMNGTGSGNGHENESESGLSRGGEVIAGGEDRSASTGNGFQVDVEEDEDNDDDDDDDDAGQTPTPPSRTDSATPSYFISQRGLSLLKSYQDRYQNQNQSRAATPTPPLASPPPPPFKSEKEKEIGMDVSQGFGEEDDQSTPVKKSKVERVAGLGEEFAKAYAIAHNKYRGGNGNGNGDELIDEDGMVLNIVDDGSTETNDGHDGGGGPDAEAGVWEDDMDVAGGGGEWIEVVSPFVMKQRRRALALATEAAKAEEKKHRLSLTFRKQDPTTRNAGLGSQLSPSANSNSTSTSFYPQSQSRTATATDRKGKSRAPGQIVVISGGTGLNGQPISAEKDKEQKRHFVNSGLSSTTSSGFSITSDWKEVDPSDETDLEKMKRKQAREVERLDKQRLRPLLTTTSTERAYAGYRDPRMYNPAGGRGRPANNQSNGRFNPGRPPPGFDAYLPQQKRQYRPRPSDFQSKYYPSEGVRSVYTSGPRPGPARGSFTGNGGRGGYQGNFRGRGGFSGRGGYGGRGALVSRELRHDPSAHAQAYRPSGPRGLARGGYHNNQYQHQHHNQRKQLPRRRIPAPPPPLPPHYMPDIPKDIPPHLRDDTILPPLQRPDPVSPTMSEALRLEEENEEEEMEIRNRMVQHEMEELLWQRKGQPFVFYPRHFGLGEVDEDGKFYNGFTSPLIESSLSFKALVNNPQFEFELLPTTLDDFLPPAMELMRGRISLQDIIHKGIQLVESPSDEKAEDGRETYNITMTLTTRRPALFTVPLRSANTGKLCYELINSNPSAGGRGLNQPMADPIQLSQADRALLMGPQFKAKRSDQFLEVIADRAAALRRGTDEAFGGRTRQTIRRNAAPFVPNNQQRQSTYPARRPSPPPPIFNPRLRTFIASSKKPGFLRWSPGRGYVTVSAYRSPSGHMIYESERHMRREPKVILGGAKGIAPEDVEALMGPQGGSRPGTPSKEKRASPTKLDKDFTGKLHGYGPVELPPANSNLIPIPAKYPPRWPGVTPVKTKLPPTPATSDQDQSTEARPSNPEEEEILKRIRTGRLLWRQATEYDFAIAHGSVEGTAGTIRVDSDVDHKINFWLSYRFHFLMDRQQYRDLKVCLYRLRLLEKTSDESYLRVLASTPDPRQDMTINKVPLSVIDIFNNLPFSSRWLVEGLVSHAIIRTEQVEAVLNSLSRVVERNDVATRDQVLESLFCLERIGDIDKTIQTRSRVFVAPLTASKKHKRHQSIETREDGSFRVMIYKAVVTPTRLLLYPPEQETGNSVIRHFDRYIERFLRVQFQDEEDRISVNPDVRFQDKTNSQVGTIARVRRALDHGLEIAGRKYVFLAASAAQKREHGCWFLNEISAGENKIERASFKAKDIIDWMGDLNKETIVAKHAARQGLPFSATKVVDMKVKLRKPKDDIKKGQYCYTDGVGLAAQNVCDAAAATLGFYGAYGSPSAIQIRVGGAKGVLSAWPSVKPREIWRRPSMIKFESNNDKLHVVRVSQYRRAFLNRQFIIIMSGLGVPNKIFENLFRSRMANVKGMADRIKGGKVTEEDLMIAENAAEFFPIKRLVKLGFHADPVLLDVARVAERRLLSELRWQARVELSQGVYLIGIADESGLLKESQVFCQWEDPQMLEKGRNIVKGRCVICRAPAMHPGDIRLVEAVDIPELRHLKNVIVFNVKGDRDLPNMLSGGDLDGDDYTLIWDKEIVNYIRPSPPADYTPLEPKRVAWVTPEDIKENFVDQILNDTLGLIGHAHLAFADSEPRGVFSAKCLELCAAHSTAVDFPKTGVPAKLPSNLQPSIWPDFMGKNTQNTKPGKSILGIVYQMVTSEEPQGLFVPTTTQSLPSFAASPSETGPAANAGCLDPRLGKIQVPEAILRLACRLKMKHDFVLTGLCIRYKLTEMEIISGLVLRNGKRKRLRDGDLKDPIRNAYKDLVKTIKSEANRLMEPHAKKAQLLSMTPMELFAVACYHISYDVDKQKELMREGGIGYENDEMPES